MNYLGAERVIDDGHPSMALAGVESLPGVARRLESVDIHASHKKAATMAMNDENRSASLS